MTGMATRTPREAAAAPGDAIVDRPILVLGLPRSGTSLITGLLGELGAWLGPTGPAAPANPRGFFENAALRDGVDKTLLTALGCDPLGVAPLPPLDSVPRVPEMRSSVIATIERAGYAHDRPWLFKDAKMTLVWPAWRAMFPDARFVIVRRPDADVIRSCLATDFMNQHGTDTAFWADFTAAYHARLDALKQSGAWWREVWADQVIADAFSSLESVVKELGLQWNEEVVRAFVVPTAWHGVRGDVSHGNDRSA